MRRSITSDEIALIAAIRPFTGPRAQQVIDTFLDIANKHLEATSSNEVDIAAMREDVSGILKQQTETFMVLSLISAMLTLPEALGQRQLKQQEGKDALEVSDYEETPRHDPEIDSQDSSQG